MQENKYDDEAFFQQYSQMSRSVQGLSAAGEWHALRALLPDLRGARVLDLGCGFGWHCRYAAEQGAASVVGLDLSANMLAEAARRNPHARIVYQRSAIEDSDFPPQSFDLVLSSLALHYVPSFAGVCAMVARLLKPGGHFVFSVEHPVFTAQGSQDWYCDAAGSKVHWPVDRYFSEGVRQARFLGEEVTKYHTTLTTYIRALLKEGLQIRDLVEPEPDPALLDVVPGMRDELRRPMMLLVAACLMPSGGHERELR